MAWVISYSNGDKYEGQFLNNIIQGAGILTKVMEKYNGSWVDGKMEEGRFLIWMVTPMLGDGVTIVLMVRVRSATVMEISTKEVG